MQFKIKWKRAYEKVEEMDGFRVLVDRLWPRGLKKEDKNTNFKEFEDTVLKELKKRNVTLIYASRIPELSHIPVLRKFIEEKLRK